MIFVSKWDKLTKMVLIYPCLKCKVQWPSEYRTSPVFEWSKQVQLLNGPVFEWHLDICGPKPFENRTKMFGFRMVMPLWNPDMQYVRYSDESYIWASGFRMVTVLCLCFFYLDPPQNQAIVTSQCMRYIFCRGGEVKHSMTVCDEERGKGKRGLRIHFSS